MANREVAVQKFLRDLYAGTFKSTWNACRAWGVSQTTLRHDLAGHAPNTIAHLN